MARMVPAIRILQLSDTHVSASGPDEDGVDAVGSLERILHDVRHVPDVDVVVVSGDVADDGSAAGCVVVRERVGEFAQLRNIPQVYSTGNHDRRPGFVDALGSGHLGPDGAQVGTRLTSDTCMAVSHVGGLRVVRGRDVRVILTGHLHFPMNSVLAGVPVVVSPGVVTRVDTTAAPGLVRGVLGAGATVVDLHDDGITTHVLQARDARAGEEVYVYDPVAGAMASERDST